MITAYEDVNRAYGKCLENLETFDSKKILRIVSAMTSTSPQPTVRTMEIHDPRRIQHVRVPDEPHVQGGAVESAIRLEKSRQVRNPAMEPLNQDSAKARQVQQSHSTDLSSASSRNQVHLS